MIAPRRYGSRDEWLRARRIGSSDVATILGVGPSDEDEPRKSVWDTWLRLRGEARPDRRSREADRGVALEPRVLAAYARATGRDVRPTPPHTLYTRDEWASATPDALDPVGVVEAKTDRNWWRWGPEATIERWSPEAEAHVRRDYYLQVVHQMFVLDAPAGHLAVLLPGRDPFLPELRIYRIERDRELETRLAARLSAWWRRHIVDGRPPDLDGSSAASTWLGRQERTDEERPATAEEAALAGTYQAAKSCEEHWRQVRKLAGQHLVAAAGTHHRLTLPGGGRITIVRTAGRTTLDEHALLADHPELAELLNGYRQLGNPSAHPRIAGTETT